MKSWSLEVFWKLYLSFRMPERQVPFIPHENSVMHYKPMVNSTYKIRGNKQSPRYSRIICYMWQSRWSNHDCSIREEGVMLCNTNHVNWSKKDKVNSVPKMRVSIDMPRKNYIKIGCYELQSKDKSLFFLQKRKNYHNSWSQLHQGQTREQWYIQE